MRLTRVFCDTPLAVAGRIPIEGSAANHIAHVLRLRAGDSLTLFDGRGGEYGARIEAFRKEAVIVTVLEHRPLERESPLELTLAQGISRGERMDLVIQKATELGVRHIVPVLTERSVVRLDAAQAGKKWRHWRGIIAAACEQCGRNTLPDLAEPLSLLAFLERQANSESIRVLLSPAGAVRAREIKAQGSHITVLIGPEGGLSEAEHAAAAACGFIAMGLGPRILRTETAALAALAVLQEVCGDL